MNMNQPIIKFPVLNVPPQYQPLVEPAKEIGTRLGDAIADGWDSFIDWLFTSRRK